MISERNTFAFHNAQAMRHNAQMHMQLNNENEAKKCRQANMQICTDFARCRRSVDCGSNYL